jgi:hypothetical protein
MHELAMGAFAATRDPLKPGISKVLEQFPDFPGHAAH